MPLKTEAELIEKLNGAVRTDGVNGKTKAQDVRTFLEILIGELIERTKSSANLSDDVLEIPTFEALPGSGEAGKIYVVLSTNTIYRWSGSGYVSLGAGGGVQSIGGQTGAVTLSQLSLDAVDNTHDLDKPLSTATLTALAGKADINDARLLGLDALVNNKAVRISTNAARTRTYYTGIGTRDEFNRDDGVIRALRDATPGETVHITTPLVFPHADAHAAVLLLPANIILNLGGFSLTSTQRQDGLGFTATGNYTIYGGDATIYSTGPGSCGLTWPISVTPIIRAYDLHLENTGTASCALVRSGSVFHRGSITVKSANGVNLESKEAQYELVGDMTVHNNSTGFQVAAGCVGLMRQGRFMVVGATGGVAIIFNGGKLELMQCVVDLTAGPTTSGVRLQTATSTLILTDVTVLAGSIVDATSSLGQVTLRGSTVLPAAYGAAYLRAKGLTVIDERPVALAY